MSAAPIVALTEAHAAAVAGPFVVVVQTDGGRHRRRCYLSLSAAESAVRRAEAAGHVATAVLARLEPVEVLS